MHPTLGDYDLVTAVARGWGLAISCRACGEKRSWTDRTLEERFAGRLQVRGSDVADRLVCGCGSRKPVAYWFNAGTRNTGPSAGRDVGTREAELRTALFRHCANLAHEA